MGRATPSTIGAVARELAATLGGLVKPSSIPRSRTLLAISESSREIELRSRLRVPASCAAATSRHPITPHSHAKNMTARADGSFHASDAPVWNTAPFSAREEGEVEPERVARAEDWYLPLLFASDFALEGAMGAVCRFGIALATFADAVRSGGRRGSTAPAQTNTRISLKQASHQSQQRSVIGCLGAIRQASQTTLMNRPPCQHALHMASAHPADIDSRLAIAVSMDRRVKSIAYGLNRVTVN